MPAATRPLAPGGTRSTGFLPFFNEFSSKIHDFFAKNCLIFAFQAAITYLPTTHLATGEDVKENEHLRENVLLEYIENARNCTENLLLLIAAVTVEQIRQQIHEETQFFCSAGMDFAGKSRKIHFLGGKIRPKIAIFHFQASETTK